MLDIDFTEGGWFDGLPPSQSQILEHLLEAGNTEEQVAEIWLSSTGSASTSGFGTVGFIQSFFLNVKAEFVAFVCGDPKYEKERTDADLVWKQHGKISLVGFTAAFIGHAVGLAAGALVPVVALLFSLLSKIGRAAFCAAAQSPDRV